MDEKTIKEIVTAFDAYKNREDDATFFSVIGRTYDEDLFSRLILKCLKDDPGAVTRLLTVYDEKQMRQGIDKGGIYVDEARCEQATEGQSRVDIFIKGGNASGDRFALLIENKIGSSEHDEQTKTYESWADKHHEDEAKYYVYLKPSWNRSEPASKKFVTVDYEDLPDMFTVENRFIEELKLHIAKQLEVKRIMDPIVFKYSKDLFETVKWMDWKRRELGREISKEVHKEITAEPLIEDHSPGNGIWRFYAKNLQWWNPDYRYYFYIEFKIGESGDFNDICVQRTLKTYKDSAAKLNEFMREFNEHTKLEKSTNPYSRYWIRKWDIAPAGEVFSPEWSSSIKNQILEKMGVAFKEQQAIVEAFLVWDKKDHH